jgi:hypothetical protein
MSDPSTSARPDTSGAPTPAQENRWTSLRGIAGWLIILSGFLALVNGVTAVLNESWFHSLDLLTGLTSYGICEIGVLVAGFVAIAGGIAAIRGKSLSLALAGAGLGILAGGILGFFMGLAALVLLFFSDGDL